ncbi:hypothetical protein [Paenibacillus foliorum]|nr:hypothetical protein [Paenibacillus foliorum]
MNLNAAINFFCIPYRKIDGKYGLLLLEIAILVLLCQNIYARIGGELQL